MTASRYTGIGIKQVIRLEWLQKTTNLMLAGLGVQDIRRELHDFLKDRKGDGSRGLRSELTREFAVTNLMKIWVSPEAELIAFRDACLAVLSERPDWSLPLHWAMISAAYPFWFNVARQTGKLLGLQEQITQAQIVKRLKETYGDRSTLIRYSKFVIRSFIAWGVLNDAKAIGCYAKAATLKIESPALAAFLLEGMLHALPDSRASLTQLLNNPAFFPFQLPPLNADHIFRQYGRIEVMSYGLDETIIKLNKPST